MPDLEKINNGRNGRARILFAPLDWGLGHTTRCLPIINAFLLEGAEVAVACNEGQETLLRPEIRGARFFRLDGYGLRYSTSRWLTWAAVGFQVPKILTAIKRENNWLRSLLEEEKFDVVVSDNRYGFHHVSCYSIFITHQLRVRVPFSRLLENVLQRWNYKFIRNYDECWIPDVRGEKNLSGKLAHPNRLPGTEIKYIGVVSRFMKNIVEHNSTDLLVLISGPEPQRTKFEKRMLSELQQWKGTAVVVRGLPTSTERLPGFNNISFHNHLPTFELNQLMERAALVIARSGYSTVMDIVAMRKKSVLVPTPGQTEQEYLAAWLTENKFCMCIDEGEFHLIQAIDEARKFEYADLSIFPTNQYAIEVKDFMQRHFTETVALDV